MKGAVIVFFSMHHNTIFIFFSHFFPLQFILSLIQSINQSINYIEYTEKKIC